MTRSVYPSDPGNPTMSPYAPPSVLKIRPRSSSTKRRNLCTGCCLILSLVFLGSGILVFLFFRNLVQSIVESKVPLRENSDVTKSWLKPPVTPLLRLYFFNVTNMDDFLNGSKPILVETGPYVYEEEWEKVDVSWLENGKQVEYGQKKSFSFSPEQSVGTEDDLLVLPNIPVISGISQMKFESQEMKTSFDAILIVMKQKLFYTISVKDILWGHEHPIVQLGNTIAKKGKKLPFNDFGLFIGKNESYPGLIKAMTGTEDVSEIGKVLTFNGKSELDFWGSEECNKISGTDGSIFHPGVQKTDILHIFNKDLCRSLPLVFQKEVVTNGGIPGYRFAPPSNVFGTPEENPFNACFCNNCSTPSGLFNLSNCQFDSPILLSWPHFFQADPKLLDEVVGLNPNKEQHQFFLDIQPKLGNGLRAFARTQINLAISPVEGISSGKGLREIIFPIAWFSDGIDGIEDEDTISLLKKAIFLPEKARSLMYPSLLSLGAIILLGIVLYLVWRMLWKIRREKNSTKVADKFVVHSNYDAHCLKNFEPKYEATGFKAVDSV